MYRVCSLNNCLLTFWLPDGSNGPDRYIHSDFSHEKENWKFCNYDFFTYLQKKITYLRKSHIYRIFSFLFRERNHFECTCRYHWTRLVGGVLKLALTFLSKLASIFQLVSLQIFSKLQALYCVAVFIIYEQKLQKATSVPRSIFQHMHIFMAKNITFHFTDGNEFNAAITRLQF